MWTFLFSGGISNPETQRELFTNHSRKDFLMSTIDTIDWSLVFSDLQQLLGTDKPWKEWTPLEHSSCANSLHVIQKLGELARSMGEGDFSGGLVIAGMFSAANDLFEKDLRFKALMEKIGANTMAEKIDWVIAGIKKYGEGKPIEESQLLSLFFHVMAEATDPLANVQLGEQFE